MNLSSILVVVLVIILISLGITFIVLHSLRPSILQSLTPKSGDLNKQLRIGNAGQVRDIFMSPPSATLMVYIQCEISSRTPTVIKDENPIRLLQLGNALQLQVIPGNSTRKSSTYLIVKTQN